MGEIDNLNEKFTAEIKITSKWLETTETDIIDYDIKKHWNPKLFIQNILSEPKENTTYEIEKLIDCLRITEHKIIKGQFWERMELYDVPFDLQELNVIVSTNLKSNQIKLIADIKNFVLTGRETKRTFIDQQKWRLFDICRLSYSLNKSQTTKRKSLWSNNSRIKNKDDIEKNKIVLDKVSKSLKIVATCFVSRHPGYYMFNAFSLIFLITVSALTAFSIPKNLHPSRLQTTYTIMLSSISFKWVFNRSLPSVSYLTLLDRYSIAGILYINLLAAWHSIIGSYYKQWDDSVDFWMFIGFLLLLAVVHIYFIGTYFIITKEKRNLLSLEKEFVLNFLRKNNLESLRDLEED